MKYFVCFVILNVVSIFHYAIVLGNIPEENMDVTEMIRYHGYPCEEHKVQTDDGYILTIQRIPHGRNNKLKSHGFPVFLQHGFVDTAATWTMNLPSQSLAFILADAGYDVWLGNSRGNVYSNQHINMTIDDAKYWDFSFDEMAKYDVPACIDFITFLTNHLQVYYVGHSQGTTIGFIAFEDERIAGKVKGFFALAPVTTVSHIRGAISVMADFDSALEMLFKILGIHEFMPSNRLIEFIAQRVCGSFLPVESVCGNLIFLIAGFDMSNLNKTRVPIYLSHLPAGTSVKDLVHYLQMVKSGKFCMYDYGDGNMKRYNQTFPPSYNVSAVKTPVAIYYGGNDWLADVQDVRNSVLPLLQNRLGVKYLESWNHLDFVWGIEANKYIYSDILKLMVNH